MGRKKASYYASRVGKRSRGRRGFKGTRKGSSVNIVDNNSSNDVNTDPVNTNNTVNIINTPWLQTDNVALETMSTPNKLCETIKKKKFRKLCNRITEKIESNSTLFKKKLTATKSKLRPCHENKKGHLYHPVEGYKIIETDILITALKTFAVCAKCKSTSIELQNNELKKNVLCESLRLICKICSHEKKIFDKFKEHIDEML